MNAPADDSDRPDVDDSAVGDHGDSDAPEGCARHFTLTSDHTPIGCWIVLIPVVLVLLLFGGMAVQFSFSQIDEYNKALNTPQLSPEEITSGVVYVRGQAHPVDGGDELAAGRSEFVLKDTSLSHRDPVEVEVAAAEHEVSPEVLVSEPGDLLHVVGYARAAGDRYRIDFDEPGRYVPTISASSVLENWHYRDLVTRSFLFLGFGLTLILVGVAFPLMLLRVRHGIVYAIAMSSVLFLLLGSMGMVQLTDEVRSNGVSTAHALHDGPHLIGHILASRGIEWDGDVSSLGSLQNSRYDELTSAERNKIEGTLAGMALRVHQLNDRLSDPSARLVGAMMGLSPRPPLDVPPEARTRADKLADGLGEPGSGIAMDVTIMGLIAGILLALFGLVVCLRDAIETLSEKHIVENLTTTSPAGVTVGPTELEGTVALREGYELESPISGERCVFYIYVVEQRHESSDGEVTWREVERESERTRFVCRDDDGDILIDPSGGTLRGTRGEGYRSGDRRHKEYLLCPGDDIYVIGSAIVDPETHEELVITAPSDDGPFEIHPDSSEDEQLDTKAGEFIAAFGLGLLSVTMAGAALSPALFGPPGPMTYLLAASLPSVPLIVLIGVFLYNNLVFLRQRVDQAWSNIDVALQRRVDLIDNLAEVVDEYLGHEKELQQRAAEARKARQDADGNRPDQKELRAEQRASDQLVATIESHPELRGQDVVDEMMQTLRDTENDVAAMRGGYNDAVERYNTRISRLPEALLAKPLWFKFRPATYLRATRSDDERRRVHIELDERG